MGRHLCIHITSVCVHWKYPLGAIGSVSESFSRCLACNNPYTPFKICKEINPFLNISKKLYF